MSQNMRKSGTAPGIAPGDQCRSNTKWSGRRGSNSQPSAWEKDESLSLAVHPFHRSHSKAKSFPPLFVDYTTVYPLGCQLAVNVLSAPPRYSVLKVFLLLIERPSLWRCSRGPIFYLEPWHLLKVGDVS